MWRLHLWMHLLFQMFWKCAETSEANPIRQSCQFRSLKTGQFCCFYVLAILELEVFVFVFFTLKMPSYTSSWVVLAIWQLGLLVSVATSGNPVALTVLMLKFFSQTEPEVNLLSVLSLIIFFPLQARTLSALIWKCLFLLVRLNDQHSSPIHSF